MGLCDTESCCQNHFLPILLHMVSQICCFKSLVFKYQYIAPDLVFIWTSITFPNNVNLIFSFHFKPFIFLKNKRYGGVFLQLFIKLRVQIPYIRRFHWLSNRWWIYDKRTLWQRQDIVANRNWSGDGDQLDGKCF